jgi:uncharacterized protein (DUF885 family)
MKWKQIFFLLPVLACQTACNTTELAELHDVFAREWAFRIAEDPLLATFSGVNDFNGRLPAVGTAESERRAVAWRRFLQELHSIDRDRLSPEEQINYDIFQAQLQDRIDEFESGGYLLSLTTDSGFHIEFAFLPQSMPFLSRQDYEDYIKRLNAFPEYVHQNIELLREGMAKGMTLPRVVLDGYEVTIASHVVDSAESSVFYAPFNEFPQTIADETRKALRTDGAHSILESVVPGYRAFLDFMQKEYIPGARTEIAAYSLPGGKEYYQQRIRHFTTLDLTPEDIHEIGKKEVARIKTEMEDIIRQTGFQGSFEAFLDFLRTAPQFYAKTPEELLKQAAFLCKRMDAQLSMLFKTLPRLPYGVAPVPAHLAPKYTAGRYIEPPANGTEPGYYWVNTYALDSRPLYTLEALTLHEAVPGHHLQIALSLELDSLPNFRRYSYLSAFGEGWALYAEWLGLEAGFYEDPYSNFGRLTYEMWRACRLVVDTGMHAFGWTRQQAIDFMASNTALSLHEVQSETDRYISWPGQALAYKLGELKIKELRLRAEEALGEKFDLREFHDAVLCNGSVPLPVLERIIDAYIESEKGARKGENGG